MKIINKVLSVAAVTLLLSGFNASASTSIESNAQMQRYTFTYNFHKPQDPVIKLTQETQTYIAYQLVNDIQSGAHYGINYSAQSVATIAYQSNLDNNRSDNHQASQTASQTSAMAD